MPNTHTSFQLTFSMSKNVKCHNDYSVHNDESVPRHCTNERKRDEKVRRDLIRQQKIEREGAAVTCDGRLFHR